MFTFRSSFVGGHLKKYIKGAYIKHNIASPNNIHSKPILFTNVPLSAGPVTTQVNELNEVNLN